MSSEVMQILSSLLKLAVSEPGQAALLRLFKDSGITAQKVIAEIDALPEVKDTQEVPNG